MVNECGDVGDMGNRSIWRNAPQCHLIYHKSHVMWPETEAATPRAKSVNSFLNYGADHPDFYYIFRQEVQLHREVTRDKYVKEKIYVS
jgi:hypothetical protein